MELNKTLRVVAVKGQFMFHTSGTRNGCVTENFYAGEPGKKTTVMELLVKHSAEKNKWPRAMDVYSAPGDGKWNNFLRKSGSNSKTNMASKIKRVSTVT